MKITEVNPNPKINEAGEIVQQMFQHKHIKMEWDSENKPTIRALVEQLNDPFLLSLTTEGVEHFIHYGQSWLDLDLNDIWLDKTGLPTYDDMLKDPAYFNSQKNTVYEIMDIRPEMYAVYVKQGFHGNDDFNPEQKLVNEYALKVLDGSKMPLGYLSYELVNDKRRGQYTSFGQEGRHRSTVAHILGAIQMPCIIIAKTQDKADLRDFSGKIFDSFN